MVHVDVASRREGIIRDGGGGNGEGLEADWSSLGGESGACVNVCHPLSLSRPLLHPDVGHGVRTVAVVVVGNGEVFVVVVVGKVFGGVFLEALVVFQRPIWHVRVQEGVMVDGGSVEGLV